MASAARGAGRQRRDAGSPRRRDDRGPGRFAHVIGLFRERCDDAGVLTGPICLEGRNTEIRKTLTTAGSASAIRSFTLHVMHHAAVKSMKIGLPSARSASNLAWLKACQSRFSPAMAGETFDGPPSSTRETSANALITATVDSPTPKRRH